jgi:hypothetical protein
MLTQDKCNAIWTLHQEGMTIRKISANCRVNRKTVRACAR